MCDTKTRSRAVSVTPSTHTLPGGRRRGRPAHSPAQSGHAAVGVAEYLSRVGKRHGKVALRARNPFDEHVRGHKAEPQLRPPHAGPAAGVVIDAADNWRLSADDRAGGPDPADRRGHELWLELRSESI